MEDLSRKLQRVLVGMGYAPDTVPHDVSHGIEHLLCLLTPEDEEAVLHYYGLFGKERLSLAELAAARHMSDEDMMARIDACVRKIAVTPEWEVLKGMINN